MKVYSPHEIAELLGVKDSTLRKYSILLEEHGYEFQRNKQNQRWYNDKDVIALRKLVTFKDNGDMSLKECAEAVCLWSRGEDVTQPSTVIHNDNDRDSQRDSNQEANAEELQELKELVHKQNQLLKQLVQRLDEEKEARQETEKKVFDWLEQIDGRQQHGLVQSSKEIPKNEESETRPSSNTGPLKSEEIKTDPHKNVEVEEGHPKNGTPSQETHKKLSWWQRLFK